MEEFSLEMRDPLPLGVPADEPKKVEDGNMVATSIGVGHITNHSSGSDGATPPPSYDEAMSSDPRLAPALERSDSDLARELHAKLNTE